MNRRTQALLLGVTMVIFWPFLLLYLIAYHHFEDKYHILATIAEYINGVKANIMHGITGHSNHKAVFRDGEIDWWMRKGRYIRRYTGLSKADVLELRDILGLYFIWVNHYDKTLPVNERFKQKKQAVTFTESGEWANDYFVFRKDGSYSFIMNDRDYLGDKHGKVDDNFMNEIRTWCE